MGNMAQTKNVNGTKMWVSTRFQDKVLHKIQNYACVLAFKTGGPSDAR